MSLYAVMRLAAPVLFSARLAHNYMLADITVGYTATGVGIAAKLYTKRDNRYKKRLQKVSNIMYNFIER